MTALPPDLATDLGRENARLQAELRAARDRQNASAEILRAIAGTSGDAAIGFTGMDFETAVRERIPIMSILLNNFSMAIELKVMPISTEKYRSTDISGNYADMARAFGAYGERVTQPGEIIPAIQRAIRKTQEGVPVLLEFLTAKEIEYSISK